VVLLRQAIASRVLARLAVSRCVFAFAFLGPCFASAGTSIPCKNPKLFDKANVNVVVLPYSRVGQESEVGSKATDAISSLLQVELIYSVLKFQNVGLVWLSGNAEDCDADAVLHRLLEDAPARQESASHQGIVLLWGEIYDDGANVYVQNFIRFRRWDANDSGEEVVVEVARSEHTEDLKGDGVFAGPALQEVKGHLSFQAFGFPSRTISPSDLMRLEKTHDLENVVIRDAPEDGARSTQALFEDHHDPIAACLIGRKSGDWSEVEVRVGLTEDGRITGWLRAPPEEDSAFVRSQFSESLFIRGAVGYLQVLTAGLPASDPVVAIKALRAYNDSSHSTDDRTFLSRAVSRQMEGHLLLLSEPDERESRPRAHDLFREAYDLIPFSAEARNLAVITDQAFAPGGRTPSGPPGVRLVSQPSTKPVSDLWSIGTLEPSKTQVQSNARVLFPRSSFSETSQSDADELRESCVHEFFRSFDCIEVLFTGHPVHIAAGNIAPQNGFGAGLALLGHRATDNSRVSWNSDAVGSSNGSWRAGVYLKLVDTHENAPSIAFGTQARKLKPNLTPILERPIVNLYVQAISLNKLTYFGLGPDTTRAGRSFYGMRETIVVTNGIRPVYQRLRIALFGEVNGRFVDLRPSRGQASPSIEQLYTEATAHGLANQPIFLQIGEGVRLRPIFFENHFRLRYLAEFQQFFAPGNSAFSFRRWFVDLSHEFPLYRTSRSSYPNESIGPDGSDQRDTKFNRNDNLEGNFSERGCSF
jgi:hypothetical protein